MTQTELLRYLKISCPAWVTATKYEYGDYVVSSNITYQCIVKHTSAATFAEDLASLYWTSDTFILKCLNEAITDVNNYCNRNFTAGNYTERFNGDGLSTLYLRNSPITSITSIKILDRDTNLYTDSILEGSDTIGNSVVIDSDSIELLKGYSFAHGSRYEIVYNGGYVINAAWITATAYEVDDYVIHNNNKYVCLEAHTSGTFATDLAANKWELTTAEYIPEDIIQVVLEKAAWVFKESPNSTGYLGLGSLNMNAASSGGTNIDRDSMIQRHEQIMNRYRFWNI